MQRPTPTSNTSLPFQLGTFETLTEGLDYAARGETGYNYYTIRGELRERISYAELREDAVSLARKLVKHGLPRGARIALIAETTADFHRFFFACQYASLLPVQLPVPINLGGKDAYIEQLRRMIASAEPHAAVASSGMFDLLRLAVDGLDVPMTGTTEDFLALPEGPD
ncbi:MAG: AMP-binding protein, partial [Planctomycetota bacterium]